MADESTISNPMDEAAMLAEAEEFIQAELERAQQELERVEAERQRMLASIADKITAEYYQRASRRAQKESGWLKAESLRLGSLGIGQQYRSADKPFETSRERRRPDRNIVDTKCEIAKAQIISMQFAGDEKNWELLPPSDPNQPPDAVDRVRKMEAVIADQLEACNYKAELLKFIDSLVGLGTGVLKGPVNTGKLRKRYVQMDAGDGTTVWYPEVTTESVPEIKSVPLWYFYPDDSVTCLNEGRSTIQVHPSSKSDLIELRKNPGFIPEAIDEALEIGPQQQVGDSFTSFAALTDSNPSVIRNKFVVLEYHGPITKTQLDTLDISAPYEAPGDEYYGEVWVVNGKVIRIELELIEGCYRPPYSGDVWQIDPSSPFGFGVAEKLADAQRVVTQAWHMILDNASASSAPQVVINEEMIDPRNGEYELAPGKIWYFTEVSGDVSKAFQFFVTPNVTAALFPVLDAARASAEEESGIALMSAGLQAPEVGSDTATGQAIMQRAATVLLDQKSDSIDTNATEPRIRAMYDWNMQYNPREDIKMDMDLRVKSSTEYRNKQMYIRDMEKLSVEASQNPETQKHIDMNQLIRARLAMMTLPSQTIVKDMQVVLQEEKARKAQPPQPDPAMMKAIADLERIKLEERRLNIEEQKLQFELGANQRREEMEFRERELTTYARIAESEAAVVKSQNEKEIAMLQIAAKAQTESERNQIMAGIQLQNDATKRYLAGLDLGLKARDQLLTEKELGLKAKTGSGI